MIYAWFSQHRKSIRIVLGSIVMLIIFGPYLWTLGWHLTHSKTENVSGYQITIPENFFKLAQKDRIQLLRMRTVFKPELWKFTSIQIEKRPGFADVNKLDWDSVRNDERQQGKFVSSFKMNIAGSEAECLRMIPNKTQEDDVSIWCLNSNGLVVSYFGDGSDVDQFRLFMLRDVEISK